MAKKIVLVFTICWFMLFVAGCQESGKTETAVKVDSDFPASFAGTWIAEDSPWKIILSKKGEVISAILPFGEVEVKPNQKTIVEMKDGSKSVYTAGDFGVNYSLLNRNLEVTIEMKSLHVVFMDEVIDGNSTAIFTGTISKDGKTWDTLLLELIDYGPRFPQDPNTIGERLRFHKED
ncbi:MAG: hypothetical protein PHP01_06425 [Phycisphaerae bacterium]|nr:hypothetical protein [Phycisphaerae bacterium]